MAYISKITPLGSSTTYDIKDSLALRTYNRNDIGISPNFDDPGVNGFFEIRNSTETTGESGTKPFNGYGAFLTMKTPDNITMMQLAGGNSLGWYIRGKQSANVTLNGVAWDRLVTNSGTWDISISGNAATATKATQDASGNIITSTYVKKSGDTMTGAINTANNTWNKIGDDAQLGDINETGTIGIQGINGNTSLRFTTYNQTTKTEGFKLSWDNNNFSLGNFLIHKTGGKIIYCKDNLISTSTVKIDGTANLTTDDNISEWLKALLKQICIEYPNKADYIFKGYITPNSKLYYEICIYNTGTTDSTTKLPQYSFGTFSHWSTTHGTFGTSSYDFWRNTIIDSVNYTSYTVKKDGTGASGDWNINITGNAATATTANAVAWSNVTGKPIELGAYSGALNTNGWKTLGARTSGAKIYIAYNNNAATWNSSTYSASMVFGCNDTKGLLDCGYNTPIVTFGGSANANSTDNAPNWYFKLSGTSGTTYTFPTSSKTLVATDGTGASGTWGISITGNAATATTASKLGTTTIGSARQPIYLNAGVPTAGNYTVAHLGNAGKSNMNDVGKLHSSMGMTSLADPGNTTDNPGNQTSWHHYISISYTDDPSGTNSWVTQFANKAGTTDLWMRSRSGGTITNGTAWGAPWTRVLTESNISNAIHISGLNLLPNTQTLETANGGTEVRNDTPFPWCYSRSIVGTTSNIDLSYNNIITPEPDTYYTLSYWAKASAATTIINYFHPSLVAAGYNSQGRTTTAPDGNLTMDIDTTWKKYWVVYKTNSTCSGSKTVILGRLSAKDGITLYIALPKLEKGKIPTDWTPNPGDGIHLYGRTGNTNILYNGGASTAADYSLVLHGNSTNGSSGIAFLSGKGNTTINYPSDRAFIQYHPYGITTYTAEGTLPTLATSGEANKLVIGVGNDSNDQVRLQTPGRTGLLHQVAASAYVIPDTGNETGTVGGQYVPIYSNAGALTQITTNSVLTDLASTTAVSTYAASPRPGITGTLGIGHGGTEATTAADAAWNLLHCADPGDINTAKRMGVFKISNTTTNTPVANMWGASLNITDDTATGNTGSGGGTTWQLAFQSNTTSAWLRAITNSGNWTNWAKLLTDKNYTDYTVTKTGTGASGTWGISITGSAASCTGNAATADTWKTARTLTIGNTGKSVNGSANVSWTKAEILGSGTTSQFYRGDNTWASLTLPYGETLPSTGSTGDIFLQTGAEYYELPIGGATGRLLMKRSTTDRDVQWTNNVYVSNDVLFGAAWNDYAEYRKDNPTEEQEAGKCVYENGDGSLSLTTQRLMRGCEIISDTFGFAIGQDTDNGYNTPIASSGRVLAFPYESIEEFSKHIGWPVCSGPNGTVSIMTEEEEEKYPSRIIGTISEIPKYKEWGTGKIQVNGRIWIRIK